MNAFSRLDIKALRRGQQERLRAAMARLPHFDAPALPELPTMLKSIVERLSDLTDAAADLPARPAPASGGSFETRSHAGAAGRRSYKLFVPGRYDGTPMPLLVMLHGCTQSPEDFALGTRMNSLAEEAGLLIAYPAQSRGANLQKCWNWFTAENQLRDHGETALVAGITREVMDEFAVAPKQVYVAGLSAGGALAAILGAIYPDLFAAVGVHSGLGLGAAHDLSSAMAAMARGPGALPANAAPVPMIIFHGDQDKTVNPANAVALAAQARAGATLRQEVTTGEAGGIAYTRTVETTPRGRPMLEFWELHGAGHAWSGGDPAGHYADPRGPDASREMLRFFRGQGRQRD